MVLILILVTFLAPNLMQWFKISMDSHSIFLTTRYFYSSDNRKYTKCHVNYYRLISFRDTFAYKEFEMESINDNTVV